MTALIWPLIGTFCSSELVKLTMKVSMKSSSGVLPVAWKSGSGVPGGMTVPGGMKPPPGIRKSMPGGTGTGNGSGVHFGVPMSVSAETC